MVGKKARTSYKQKRKGKPFSGRQRYKIKGQKQVPCYDMETSTQPSCSGVGNSSDSDSKKSFGPSRKKMEHKKIDFSLESSDNESSFQTRESEGYRMVDLEKLWKAVSSAHVFNARESFFFILKEHHARNLPGTISPTIPDQGC